MELIDKYIECFKEPSIYNFVRDNLGIELNLDQQNSIKKMEDKKGSMHIKPRRIGKTTSLIAHMLYSLHTEKCENFMFIVNSAPHKYVIHNVLNLYINNNQNIANLIKKADNIDCLAYTDRILTISNTEDYYIYMDEVLPYHWTNSEESFIKSKKSICTLTPPDCPAFTENYLSSMKMIENL